MTRFEGISISDGVVGSIAVRSDRVAVVAKTQTVSSTVYVIVAQVIGLRHSKRRAVRAPIRLSFQGYRR
jgi:hypothetical protein